jgi:hypothetical protein
MIHEFISRVRTTGIARTNRYEVTILPLTGSGDTARLVTIMCNQANLPGMLFESTPHRVYGESREMPYERMFEPVNLSFYMDARFDVKEIFENWMNSIMSPYSREMRYYKTYVKTVLKAFR